jgi:hypothetical protein
MYSIQKSTTNGKRDHSASDTTAASPDPSPTDPWLFTDPFARDHYLQRGLLNRLEEDIRAYAMFEGCWTPEELDYKLEVRRLLRGGFIAPAGSFGYLSPHPTVYRIVKSVSLVVAGQRYALKDGEDLVFESWLARYSDPGLRGPLRVGRLYGASDPRLSCDAFPQLHTHCGKTLAIMRQILKYRENRK